MAEKVDQGSSIEITFTESQGGEIAIASSLGRASVNPAVLDEVLRANDNLQSGFEAGVRPLVDPARLMELGQSIEHEPHIVHLSGHDSLDKEGIEEFAFEDERGHSTRPSS